MYFRNYIIFLRDHLSMDIILYILSQGFTETKMLFYVRGGSKTSKMKLLGQIFFQRRIQNPVVHLLNGAESH